MLTFRKNYFLLAVALFIIEVMIALYVNDKIIRPYIGDVLVVILLYAFLMAFIKLSPVKAIIIVWLFAVLIEWLQYLKFVKMIGLSHHKLANVVLGNSFSWIDILAYTIGAVVVLMVEFKYNHSKNR